MIINGSGAAITIIDGAGLDRVFDIDPQAAGVTVEIFGVTIQNGFLDTGQGGGVRNSGTRALNSSTVNGNTLVPGILGFDQGGGIFNSGKLTLISSTINGNTATGVGGGIGDGGGIYNLRGSGTLTNVTVSGNTAATSGGILNSGAESTLTLISSTINGNMATGVGGGIRTFNSVTLKNTIVANNTPDDCSREPFTSPIASAGHNPIEDTSGCFIFGDTTGNIIGVDHVLGPLVDNGGLTLTHALLPGSPAIDAGSLDCPPSATDQRGVARPQGAACDIGAFKLVQNQPPTANAGGPYSGDEGSPIALNGSSSTEDIGIFPYEWDCTDDGTFDESSASSTGNSCTYPDNGSFTVRLRVTDTNGATDEDTASVMVYNVAPMVDAATIAPEPSEEGSSVTARAALSYPGGVNNAPFTCTVDYGDGSGSQAGTISGNT